MPIDVLPLPRSPTGVAVGVDDGVAVGVGVVVGLGVAVGLGVGVGCGGLASAVDKTAEQANISRTHVNIIF